MSSPSPSERLSDEELALVRANLRSALERARKALEWTEIVLILSQARQDDLTDGVRPRPDESQRC